MGLSRKLADLGKFIDSAATSDFLTVDDSGGKFRDVLWTEIAGKPTTLDSAAAQAIVDSAYVQARQVDVGLDSALVTSLVDSSYVQARQGDVGLDSAGITGIVDSAYVNARITSGLDSAGTISLIDSTYVDARTTANSGFKNYRYTATAGQTAFTNSDENGSVLYYSDDALLVFYNGVVLEPTVDYTTSGNDTVTLTEGADSGVSVNVATWTIQSSGGSSSFSWGGDRGLFSAGETSSGTRVNTIDYVDLTSAGNATDFGDLTVGRSSVSSTSSTSRSVFILGFDGTNSRNEMDYVSPATTGNASDFGDYVFAGSGSNSGVISNNTTGIYGGAFSAASSNRVNNISKITIATTGNATDFGDLSNGRSDLAAGTDVTRGVFMGGRDATTSAAINTIEYITIASDGNATDFGDLITAKRKNIGTSDATYSFSFGGIGDLTAIEYITTQTTGNATNFGSLLINTIDGGACCNGTTAVLTGFQSGTGVTNTIQQITTATAGNATDFGDLTQARFAVGSASGAAS